jgi:opacity protein-like surface antigen
MANAVEAVVVFAMRLGAHTIWTAIAFGVALAPACVNAEESFDTEHIFGFMIGTDVGNPGEREFQTQTTGRFGKGGTYRALQQEVEIEVVPLPNFRIEVGGTATLHDITGVPDIDDRRQFNFQGASLDLRYRLLDRGRAPFGLTVAAELHGDRIDETSGAKGRMYGSEFTLAFDRELIPNYAIAALNLIYQPEWARFEVAGVSEKSSTIGAAFAGMVRVRPDVLLGGEMRYFRQYEGIGLGEFAGQALFVGPTAYFQLSEKSRLTLSWSMQAWGRPAGSSANLDLVNFERHQARLVFGVNF